jgi:hypothetical protein
MSKQFGLSGFEDFDPVLALCPAQAGHGYLIDLTGFSNLSGLNRSRLYPQFFDSCCDAANIRPDRQVVETGPG